MQVVLLKTAKPLKNCAMIEFTAENKRDEKILCSLADTGVGGALICIDKPYKLRISVRK